jgi:general secretion pathway protein K
MGSKLTDDKGFALLLTILTLAVIVAVSLQFHRDTRADLTDSVHLRDRIQLDAVARSAVDLAMAYLVEDGAANQVDTLRESWASAPRFAAMSQGLFENGSFVVEISDLCGRIQINHLLTESGEFDPHQRDLLIRFLSRDAFGLDDGAVADLLDALKDWMDADGETTRFGAESAFYAPEGYGCANGPLERLEELLLIRGVTPALFYGTRESPGISAYLTVHGEDGAININTADPVILEALSEDLDAGGAEDMADYRADEDADLRDPNWYKQVAGLSHLAIPGDLVTVRSSWFEVRVVARRAELHRAVRAVVERTGGAVGIASWKIL